MKRPPHRPPNPHAAEAVAMVHAEEISPEEAAERLTAAGKPIGARTIRRAMASSEAPPRPETARGDRSSGGSSSASSTIPTGQNYRGDGGSARPTGDEGGEPTHGPTGGDPRASGPGPSLPAAKLADLRDLIGRLPFAQQDALVTTLPLERLRREAIARGLAPYHEAAAAVARELRAVRL